MSTAPTDLAQGTNVTVAGWTWQWDGESWLVTRYGDPNLDLRTAMLHELAAARYEMARKTYWLGKTLESLSEAVTDCGTGLQDQFVPVLWEAS